MSTFFNFLSGKKTYLTGVVALILLFGSWQHWWSIPAKIYEALMAVSLIFLRSGVAKGSGGAPTASIPSKVVSGVRKIPVMAFACFLLVCGVGVCLSGCGTTTPQQATYQAAGTTVVSVDTAMQVWGKYVAQAHPPVSQEKAVADAYAKYQAAMAAVCDAGEVYAAASQPGGTNIYGTTSSASVALQAAVANASQEISDLEKLITSFGVKL